MTKAVAISKGEFSVPSGITSVRICKVSNKLATPACPDEQIMASYVGAGSVRQESCDVHVLIDICSETGLLATPGCPTPVQQGFDKTLAPGVPGAIPQEYCPIHGGQVSTHRVTICTDPRHHGRIYLANVSGNGETGGCPGEYIAEIEINNPEQLTHCPLPEHQIQRLPTE